MWGNPLEGGGTGLGKFLNKIPKCKVLDLDRCYMKEEDLENTSRNIENTQLQVSSYLL